jgi:hypothetical protein
MIRLQELELERLKLLQEEEEEKIKNQTNISFTNDSFNNLQDFDELMFSSDNEEDEA